MCFPKSFVLLYNSSNPIALFQKKSIAICLRTISGLFSSLCWTCKWIPHPSSILSAKVKKQHKIKLNLMIVSISNTFLFVFKVKRSHNQPIVLYLRKPLPMPDFLSALGFGFVLDEDFLVVDLGVEPQLAPLAANTSWSSSPPSSPSSSPWSYSPSSWRLRRRRSSSSEAPAFGFGVTGVGQPEELPEDLLPLDLLLAKTSPSSCSPSSSPAVYSSASSSSCGWMKWKVIKMTFDDLNCRHEARAERGRSSYFSALTRQCRIIKTWRRVW